ncbi:Os05g0508750 [Oryza sativa Japonica Group]|uniref:Os05g0508750 protein n=1 Tax=Oryza sativa subsp. japonica TaxID=39947 RepID=A0A0P0WPE6_ORYSJ|nr:Os05g0508750 [Oryza sativa Japonica Group]
MSMSTWIMGAGSSSKSAIVLPFLPLLWYSSTFRPVYRESITNVEVTSFSTKKCFTNTFNMTSVFSLDIRCLVLGSIADQKAQKLDHLILSSISLLSLFLRSSTKRRYIDSMFVV